MTQYYQLTLKDALTQYQAGFLSSAGLLFNYFKIKFAPGWKIHINQAAICTELGLSRDQFYRGLKLIKQHFPNLKLHRTTALVGEFEESNTSSDDKNPVDEPVAPATNSSVTSPNPVAPTATKVVETATNAPPKAPKTKQQSDSPDSLHSSYTEFISTLSKDEREKFLEFCQKRVDSFDVPLKCGLKTFLAARNKETGIAYFTEFWELYKKEGCVLRNSINEKHSTIKPDFPKWYYWMKEIGIMVRKYDWRGEVGAIDNCGKSQSFEEWLKIYSMEEAKQRFDASNRWGR